MTIHHPEHGEFCMCTGCYTARAQARAQACARERIERERVREAIPERDVHWPWLHGDTPPPAPTDDPCAEHVEGCTTRRRHRHTPVKLAERAEPLLVLADTYQLACDYARDHDLGRPGDRWRYISSVRDVLGRQGPGRYVLLTIRGHRLGLRAAGERQDALWHLRSHGFEAVDPATAACPLDWHARREAGDG